MAGKKSKRVPKPNGRPSKFKEEYCLQAKKLCRLGATDKELADFFEVSESTLNLWKKHESFSESLKAGKALSDAEVANKLFRRATGYSHPDVDIKCYEGHIIETEIIKHYPPDTTAAIFWLKNRQSEKWRDKQETVHSGEVKTLPSWLTDASKPKS